MAHNSPIAVLAIQNTHRSGGPVRILYCFSIPSLYLSGRNSEMQAQTCLTGAFLVSTETPKWNQKPDLWDALLVAGTLAYKPLMGKHPTYCRTPLRLISKH